MRFLISAAPAALLVSPAGAQVGLESDLCRGTEIGAKASKELAVNVNAASAAFIAQDYAAALNAVERARPHAADIAQRSVVAQIEVAVMVDAGAGAAVIPKLEAAILDPCLAAVTREGFTKSLEQARAKAAAPQQQ